MDDSKHTILGQVIDKQTNVGINNIPLKVEGEDYNIDLTTDDTGHYQFQISKEYPHNKTLNIIFPGDETYQPKSIKPVSSKSRLMLNVPKLILERNNINNEYLGTDMINLNKDDLEKLKSNINVDFKYIREYLKNTIKNLGENIIPVVVNLLLQFGINELNKPRTSCPSEEALYNSIRKRNKLVKGINDINKFLKSISLILNFGSTLIRAFKTARRIVKNNPTLDIHYTPVSFGLKSQETIDKLNDQIIKYENIIDLVAFYILMVNMMLQRILLYLKKLDQNIEGCIQDKLSHLPDNDRRVFMDSIDNELLEIIDEELNQDENEEFEYRYFSNGFEIDVENVITSDNTTYRRQAIALNPQGIVVLRGEPSYSLSKQVLINELIFYIEANDLKAD